MHGLVRSFAKRAAGKGISRIGPVARLKISPGRGPPGHACIDKSLAERLAGRPLQVAKDKNQRHCADAAESTV